MSTRMIQNGMGSAANMKMVRNGATFAQRSARSKIGWVRTRISQRTLKAPRTAYQSKVAVSAAASIPAEATAQGGAVLTARSVAEASGSEASIAPTMKAK